MKFITKEATYEHPPERVWRALTDPKILATWLMETDIEARAGHRFQFRMKPQPGFDGIVHCEIVEADPPRRLAYTWTGNAKKKPTLVEWTLTPHNGGTHLLLKHSGFEGIGGFFLSNMMNRGWGHKITEPQYFLAALKQLAHESQVR